MDLFEYLLAMQKGGGGAKGSAAVYSGKDIVYDSVGQYAYVSTATFPKLKDNDIYFVTETYTSNGYTFKKGSIYVLTQGTGDEFDATLLNEQGITYEEMIDVAKGDIISMNLDGTDRQYRIIKMNGLVAEVLALWVGVYSTYNSSSIVDVFSDNEQYQKYSGSKIDQFYEATYQSFTDEAKAAIIKKNITQDCWYNSNSGDPSYVGVFANGNDYRVSLKADATLAIGERYVYALSAKDIIDYLGVTPEMTSQNTTLTPENLYTMAFGNPSPGNYSLFCRSANANSATKVMSYGSALWASACNITIPTKPAFQIDLSKIPYTKV